MEKSREVGRKSVLTMEDIWYNANSFNIFFKNLPWVNQESPHHDLWFDQSGGGSESREVLGAEHVAMAVIYDAEARLFPLLAEIAPNGKVAIQLLGGYRESYDASPEDTALREVYEEFGLPPIPEEFRPQIDAKVYPVMTGHPVFHNPTDEMRLIYSFGFDIPGIVERVRKESSDRIGDGMLERHSGVVLMTLRELRAFCSGQLRCPPHARDVFPTIPGGEGEKAEYHFIPSAETSVVIRHALDGWRESPRSHDETHVPGATLPPWLS